MQKLGSGSLKRGYLALVGAVALAGFGASPASTLSQYTDKTLAPAAVRAGFLAAMPDGVALRVKRAHAGSGVGERHRTALAARAAREAKTVRTVAKLSAADQQCLAAALYYEARGEGVRGQMAVAEVVVNRAHAPGYPRSVCGVVYQGNPGGATNCQFSWACNGDMNRGREGAAWGRAHRLAVNIGTGKVALNNITDRALFFHATSVSPHWRGLVRTTQIGNHIFYRRNASYRPPHIIRTRRHGYSQRPETAIETTPRGGVLLPDGEIRELIPLAPVNIEVHPEIQASGASGDGA